MTPPIVTGPILRHLEPRELAAHVGDRLAETGTVDGVVQPATRAGGVGQGNGDRVVEHDALADRVAQPADAEQLRCGPEPDGDDEPGLEQAQLVLAPRRAERLLRPGHAAVASPRGARAGIAAGDGGAVER